MTSVDLGVPRIRTSERKDFKRCQQRWQWAWRQGLKPKYEKPGPRWFGIGMHLALQHRYQYKGTKRGKNPIKVWRDFVGDTQAVVFGDNYDTDRDDFISAKELGEIMLDGYLAKYGTDDRWHVLSAEQTFEIPIPDPRGAECPTCQGTGGGVIGECIRCAGRGRIISPLALYNGTFDLVALDQETDNSLWLWDHKNMKAITTTHLPLDDQAGSYWAVAADVLLAQKLIEPGMVLDGILYNFLRKAKPDTRPKNAEGLATNKPQKSHYGDALTAAGLSPVGTLPVLTKRAEDAGLVVLGDVSKVQPSPNFHRETVWRTRAERRTQIVRIQQEALQMERLRGKNRIDQPTKNPTKDCSWDCDFFTMCQLHEAGDDWKEFRDSAFIKEDPYAAHRDVVTDE